MSFGYQVLGFGSGGEADPLFIVASGGSPCSGSICGDYKTHSFTGPGTLSVSCAGNSSGNDKIDYMVVAGGGSGHPSGHGGGGGAGGFRESKQACAPWTASPLAAACGITAAAGCYPITIGAGGTAPSEGCTPGIKGADSIFSTITSAAGGGGAKNPPCDQSDGGSGGGMSNTCGTSYAGSGNTPPVSPPQGNDGGAIPGSPQAPSYGAGGGGGAGAAGGLGTPTAGGAGGVGVTTSISETPTAYAGGGGGSVFSGTLGPGSPCGTGGAGGKSSSSSAVAGTTNRGGGGGGAERGNPDSGVGATGGSGIVIIRYKFQ